MQSWTKKSLVAVAAGGLLVAGVGSALAGENGSTDTGSTGTTATGSSVEIAEQIAWTVDAGATSSAAAAAYREMIAGVRAAAKANPGDYLSVDVTLDGDISTLSSASGTTVQLVVRADNFSVVGWVNPRSDEFFALSSDSPDVLLGPPRQPAPPPNNQNGNQNNNQNNNRNGNGGNARNNNQNPPPPVPCVDRNGNRINQNNPQCAPRGNGREPARRRDVGIRPGNPLAATTGSAATVKLSLESIVGAFADLILGDDSTAVSDLSDAISTIIQAITGGAGSQTIEQSVCGPL